MKKEEMGQRSGEKEKEGKGNIKCYVAVEPESQLATRQF